MAAAIAACLMSVAPANAAELLMYRSAGCPWCAAWDRQVGAVYSKTEIGRRIPVRFVAMDGTPRADVQLRSRVRYSPTFVLVEDGREVARIEGYPGEAFFWERLEELSARLRTPSQSDISAPVAARMAHIENVQAQGADR